MTTKPRSRDLLPQPFDWIEIPGKGYSIAKYPLTNAQFKLFIDVGGYTNPEWWTEEGREARAKGWQLEFNKIVPPREAWNQPRYWTHKKWNRSEQPVVGVSWYEAVAYCLCLSEITGENILLPTEDQWQYAAQGDDGRVFPWGNEWDCQQCNNSVPPCRNTKTNSVMHYDGKNDSPFRAVDMAGNVWEWCLTDYNSRTNYIHSVAYYRVMRGGSWDNQNSDRFRCEYRAWAFPYERYSNRGFRLARSP